MGIAVLLYDSAWGLLAMLPLYPLFTVLKRRKLTEERKWRLNLAFGEALTAMSAALESGYSVENAVSEAYEDLRSSHVKEEPVMMELRIIAGKIRHNVPVEEAFRSFAERSGIEDVKSFADVFAMAKRSGGNVIDIIRSTSDTIHTRIEMARELRAAVASKNYEVNVMKILPVFMILYLRLSSPSLISDVYGNLWGALFMTGMMVLYAGMCLIAGRIVRIEL